MTPRDRAERSLGWLNRQWERYSGLAKLLAVGVTAYLLASGWRFRDGSALSPGFTAQLQAQAIYQLQLADDTSRADRRSLHQEAADIRQLVQSLARERCYASRNTASLAGIPCQTLIGDRR